MDRPKETMLHPFTNVPCEVQRLQPGDLVDAGDVYRSVTIAEDGMPIQMGERPGRWFHAGDILQRSPVGEGCNVAFLRLLPVVSAT